MRLPFTISPLAGSMARIGASIMSSLGRRLERLELASPPRPVRYLWDDGREPLDSLARQEAELTEQGFDVVRFGWQGRDRDAQL